MAAEEAARQAKDAVQGQADVAKMERERALAARAEAEQANKNLDSARCKFCGCFSPSACLTVEKCLMSRLDVLPEHAMHAFHVFLVSL